MAEAVLTLSQPSTPTTPQTTSQSGQRVKAHPATDTFMRGDVHGTIERISRGPKRLVLVKMDRSGRQLRFSARNLLHVDE